jgi:hypothetical protein
MNKRKLKVSDHAVLRYMERILGVDVDGIRKGMINEVFEAQVDAMDGECRIKTLTHDLTVIDYTVVTVTPK